MFIFLFLLSLLLFFFAPDKYSYPYCFLLSCVYLVGSIILINRTLYNRNYFNFFTLFLISYFFVNFVYPVFIFPNDPYYFPVFVFPFDHNVITKATGLALVGATSFFLGAYYFKIKQPVQTNKIEVFSIRKMRSLLISILTILFIGILIFGGKELFTFRFMATSNIPPGLLGLFQTSLGLFVIFFLCKGKQVRTYLNAIIKLPLLGLIIYVIFIVMFLFSGDRGPIVQIVLITLGALAAFVKPIRLKFFAVIIVGSMFILTVVAYARSKTTGIGIFSPSSFVERGLQNAKMGTFTDIGMDLIVNNRNLYVGYKYPETYGFDYGEGMFYYIFAPIPFLPTLFTQFFYNKDPIELNSASKITNEVNASYGLGTNMIGDIYMQFGVIGVVIIMFLFGRIVRVSEINMIKNRFPYIIIYFFLLSYSVYLPRTSILGPFRFICWAMALYFVFRNISRYKRQLYSNSV